MKLLVLGGTHFLGRHIVECARRLGHDVTLFNRGHRNPDLFPDLERLRGDRDGDLAALEGRRWDAAVDTCGYVPRVVRASAELLSGAVGHYTFISSISVYPDITARVDEHTPVGTLEDETVEEITGDTYGPLKALCERAVEAALPERALHVRAGLIVGPHDPTDRFTYWPHRVARGGDVLAPGRREAEVQLVDVRDLAEWIVTSAESRTTGVYNATGPAHRLSMAGVLDACREATASDARFVWVPDDFLQAQGVGAWIELPLWIPGGDMQADCTKAIEHGLTFRPLETTIRDTLAWSTTRPEDHAWRAGMKAEREAELLRHWRAGRL